MKEKSVFDKIKEVIDSAFIGDVIERKRIVQLNSRCWNVSTADNYRNYFTHAGYLKIVARGRYQKMKSVPYEMTRRQLIKEAYPNSDWAQRPPHYVAWQNEMRRM
jgi:hypothetical protein